MTAKILNGKEIANKILEGVKERISCDEKKYKLGIVLVGDNDASKVYIRMKTKKCDSIGIDYEVFVYPADISEKQLISEIQILNTNNDVSSVIIQLPLPNNLNARKIINSLDFNKDVDGLTSYNLGKLFEGNPNIIPATPKGIMKILETTNTKLEGKHAVVIGRSNLVGKPIAQLLLDKDCTVTLCHSKTKNLNQYTKSADIIVSAVGKKHLITKDMVKDGVIAIDVGITRDGKNLYGDLHSNIQDKAKYYTPVPGGVGPVTIACLIDNIVR